MAAQAAQLDDQRFGALIEALLFAADRPLTIARLRQLTRVSDTARIAAALERLAAARADSGIVVSSVSGGYSLRTHSGYSPWVQQLIAGRPVRLSRAQLETLAIVAYRQPITRPEIDQIRGVDSGATLKLLLDRSADPRAGQARGVGRPLLYGTTKEFLDFFSLHDLRELPTLREYSELSEPRAAAWWRGWGSRCRRPARPAARRMPS
jgi:segregation and condensation protein B